MLNTLKTLIILSFLFNVSIGMDVYKHTLNELGLIPQSYDFSSSQSAQESQVEKKDENSRWNTPNRLFSSASRDHWHMQTTIKEHPTKSIHKVTEPVDQKKRIRDRRMEPGFYKKENFIKREKNKTLRSNPSIHPELAHQDALLKYQVYINKRVDQTKKTRQLNTMAKEYMKGIDENLASTMQIRESNRKSDWIERRTRTLKRTNSNLTHSDAEAQAMEKFKEKRKRENEKRRERDRKRRNERPQK